MGWFQSLLYDLFTMLDKLVFGLIGTVYELLMRIADTTFFNQDTFRAFSTRIYSLLGIFMLFKITFSLLNYAINPDDMFEKSKGIQNLIGKIILVLVLLMATPTIFDRARELQRIILNNSVLENVILGIGSNNEPSAVGENPAVGDTKNTAGDRLAFVLLSSFYHPNSSFSACTSGMYLPTGVNPACLADLDKVPALGGNSAGDFIRTAWQYKDIEILMDPDLAKATMGPDNQKVTIMDYQYIISTVAGVFVVYILIIFCVDIGVRSVKLGFLELTAPIPIISYIDPKQSKDGSFNKWVKTCLNTYLDLFLRLMAIYFVVFIFDNINLLSGSTNNLETDIGVRIFIILGALLFAKKIPDLLKEVFSLGNVDFDLSWRKKMENVPIAGKALGALPTGLAAAGGAMVGAGLTNAARNAAEAGRNFKAGNFRGGMGSIGRALTAPVSGGAGALRRGAFATLQGKKGGEVYKSAYGGTKQANMRNIEARAAGATMLGTEMARIEGATGIPTRGDVLESRNKYMDRVLKVADEAKKRSLEEIAKKADFTVRSYDWTDSAGHQNTGASSNLAVLRGELETMRAAGITTGTAYADKAAQVGAAEKYAVMQYESDYYNNDAELTSMMNQFNRLVHSEAYIKHIKDPNSGFVVGSVGDIQNGADMKAVKDAIEKYNAELSRGKELARAQANREAAKKGNSSGGGH